MNIVSLKQTLLLILAVWAALFVFTLLLQGWLGDSTSLHFATLTLALGFTALALFDHLYRRLDR